MMIIPEAEVIEKRSELKQKIFPRPFETLGVAGQNKKNLMGAEIGVYKGEHAESLLKTLSIKKLYLIDPYDAYEGYKEGQQHCGKDQVSLSAAEIEAKERLKIFSDKVIYIRKKSIEAAGEIPEELDFVYIDGNHQYLSVKEDIKTYYPKVREGGVIGGHDISNGFAHDHEGVIQAVSEFAIRENLQVFIEIPDWWIAKGKRPILA